MSEQLGSRLSALRHARQLSLRQLGTELGVSANTIMRWENDEANPTRDHITKAAIFFNVDPAWLAWGFEKKEGSKEKDRGARLKMLSERQLSIIDTLIDEFLVATTKQGNGGETAKDEGTNGES